MTSFKPHGENGVLIFVALLLPCAAALWLLALRGAMEPATYAVLAVLTIATALVAFNTWKNGQAAGSMGQLIHETDVAPVNERTSHAARAR